MLGFENRLIVHPSIYFHVSDQCLGSITAFSTPRFRCFKPAILKPSRSLPSSTSWQVRGANSLDHNVSAGCVVQKTRPCSLTQPPTNLLHRMYHTHISGRPRLNLEHGKQPLESSFLPPFFSQPDGEGERFEITLEVRNAGVGVPGVSALKSLMLATFCCTTGTPPNRCPSGRARFVVGFREVEPPRRSKARKHQGPQTIVHLTLSLRR